MKKILYNNYCILIIFVLSLSNKNNEIMKTLLLTPILFIIISMALTFKNRKKKLDLIEHINTKCKCSNPCNEYCANKNK